MTLYGKGVAVVQSRSCESYFILSAKKQPAVRFLRAPLMTGVLVLFAMLMMVIAALLLGAWWNHLSQIP